MSQSLATLRWVVSAAILMLLLMMTSPGVSAVQCKVIKAGCSCQFDNGTVIDLTSLGNQDDTAKFSVTESFYTYSYNPCFPFSDGTGSCKNAAVCMKSSWANDVRGDSDSAEFTIESDGLLHVSYTAGSYYTADVALVCGGTTDKLKVTDTNYNAPKLQLTSPSVCPISPGGSGGVSGGSVMLIIFFSAIFVYLVAGVIFMHVSRGARGVERIPNYEFWRSVPGLVKDGVSFSFNKTTSSCRSSTTGYENL